MQVERDPPSGGESGARVRNAYATYLQQGDSPEKFGLIPHSNCLPHGIQFKVPAVGDGHA